MKDSSYRQWPSDAAGEAARVLEDQSDDAGPVPTPNPQLITRNSKLTTLGTSTRLGFDLS